MRDLQQTNKKNIDAHVEFDTKIDNASNVEK